MNEEEHGHGHVVEKLLKRAERLECLVAFAKTSALGDLLKPLRKALESGLKARFAIGLDFYLTEPEALRQLFALAEKHALVLYLSNASDTFHPKIYAFQNGKQCSVIVGSAMVKTLLAADDAGTPDDLTGLRRVVADLAAGVRR